MKLSEFFMQEAARTERRVDDLANQQERIADRKRALGKIEQRIEELAADGVFDPSEVAELKRLLEREGLSTASIDALAEALKDTDAKIDAKSGSRFRVALDGVLSRAKDDLGDSERVMTLKIQFAVNDYVHANQAASGQLKAEHDAYMVAIRHLIA